MSALCLRNPLRYNEANTKGATMTATLTRHTLRPVTTEPSYRLTEGAARDAVVSMEAAYLRFARGRFYTASVTEAEAHMADAAEHADSAYLTNVLARAAFDALAAAPDMPFSL